MPAGTVNTPSAELEYIALTDFTPGITKKALSYYDQSEMKNRQPNQVAARDRNGAGSIITYGCYGDPDGGLRPLPAVTKTITHSTAVESPAVDNAEYVIDATVVSPVLPNDSASSPTGPWGQEVAANSAGEYFAEEAYAILHYRTSAKASTLLRRWRMPGSTSAVLTQQTQATADGVGSYVDLANTDAMIPGGGVALTRAGAGLAWDSTVLPENEFNPQNESAWVVAATWSMGKYGARTAVYPDPTTGGFPISTTDTSTFTFDGISGGGLFFLALLAHQDRLVYLPQGEPSSASGVRPFGAMGKNAVLAAYDSLYYSTALLPVRDVNAAVGTTTYQPLSSDQHLIASADAPSGIGCFGSINAGELIAIRNTAGGVSIRGALESPTITRLPGMQGVQGAMNYGVMTPLGFVYGSRAGVFLWNGGDQSKCISPQLDGFFWNVQDETNIGSGKRIGSRGRFGWLHPFVWSPNNMVMDSRTGGWWRTVDPATMTYKHMHYAATAYGRIYAFRSAVRAGINGNVLADVFDPNYGARQYTFLSHPVPITLDRNTHVREVILVVSGDGGTVAITLGDGDDTTTDQTYTVTLPSGGTGGTTKRYRFTTDIQATDIVFSIHADSGANELPAPIVQQIIFGYKAGQSIPQVN